MAAQPARTPVILAEFNELTPLLLERFMAQGRLPNFRRLYERSHVYVSEADERAPNLEPWIQWVTVHTGLPFREHGVFHLTDGHTLNAPRVWDVASGHGRTVWVCGSMNASYQAPLDGWFLPDPWSRVVRSHPDELAPYHRFVQARVVEHTRDRVPLRPTEYVRFVSFMARHGLSAATARAIVEQLADEVGHRYRWRRAMILDRLQMDLFEHGWRRLRPALSTFMLNSTAHLQHLYWRNMDPESFAVKPTAREQAELGDVIPQSYEQTDGILGRILDLAGDEAIVILCTALSQQPCLRYEDSGGKVFARPRDFGALLSFARVDGKPDVTPVMSQNFTLAFRTVQDAAAAKRRLLALRIGEDYAMRADRDGRNVYAAAVCVGQMPDDAVVTTDDGRSMRFFDLFYRVEGTKSGMHHPDGALWVRTPEQDHVVFPSKIPLVAIAPTVLALMGLPRPKSMKGPTLDELQRQTAAIAV
jgi:hypothetical protein